MKKLKILNTVFVMLVLASALINNATVQASVENMQTFYEEEGYPGLSITIKATNETNPGGDINITIWIECTAKNLSIEHLYLSVYGFRGGQDKVLLRNITYITKKTLDYDNVSEGNYAVHIPNDFWYRLYAELHFQYAIKETSYGPYTDGFTMTDVRNVKMEELIEQLTNKTQAYEALSQNYTELNQTYTELNQTYWDLKLNKTSGTEVQLDNTRIAMVIFIVTTVFFAATTLYLVIKKPKQYW